MKNITEPDVKVAIIQSNYIPWKGYFDIINRVDIFIFLEDIQYTVRDWRNRNKIKMSDGSTKWLTVPVLNGRNQLICDARIDNSQNWKHTHLESMRHSYGKTPYFDRYFPSLQEIYKQTHDKISLLNQALIKRISAWLKIDTKFMESIELKCSGEKNERLLALIRAVGGNHYISGPSARIYIDTEKFKDSGVRLEYHDYSHYPLYPQISEPFDHNVSILDLLFMTGPNVSEYIWDFKGKTKIGGSVG